MILQVLSSTQISATGWFLLSVVPAEVCVFTQAEVFEVVPVRPHLHPRYDDDYVDDGDNVDRGGGLGDD